MPQISALCTPVPDTGRRSAAECSPDVLRAMKSSGFMPKRFTTVHIPSGPQVRTRGAHPVPERGKAEGYFLSPDLGGCRRQGRGVPENLTTRPTAVYLRFWESRPDVHRLPFPAHGMDSGSDALTSAGRYIGDAFLFP